MFEPGLYGHIQRNNLKSAALLLAFLVLGWLFWFALCLLWSAGLLIFGRLPIEARLLALDWQTVDALLWLVIGHAWKLAVAFWVVPLIASLVWLVTAYLVQERLIRFATGARGVTRRQEPRLYSIVQTMALTAGIPMPRVEIMETRQLNAYAAGLSPDDATVAVTRGLLLALDDRELEAVVAHEITHIVNRDVRLSVVAGIFAGGLSMAGELVTRFFASVSDAGYRAGDFGGSDPVDDMVFGRSRGTTGPAAGVLMFIVGAIAVVISIALMGTVRLLAMTIRFALSRSREYLADAGAVELTKDPDALISALLKISGRCDMPHVPSLVRTMMICQAVDDEDWFEALTATHPSVEDRIASLQQHAAGYLPATRPSAMQPAAVAPSAPPHSGETLGAARLAFGRRPRRSAS
jgi:heat shock protein HtpX